MITKKKEIIYISLLLLFSVFINQYYGYLGVHPIDSFFPFNSGYDFFKGYYPFKDYWTITGPFLDIIQAIFFKIFGVSWFSYVLHASIFNSIFTIFFFFVLRQHKLDLRLCFFYALSLSLLAYPSSGTPYVDHHSSYLSAIAVISFIMALKSNSKIWWFLIPLFFGISFLTKQTPTGYVFVFITFLLLIYFSFYFNLKNILLILSGSLVILLLFFLFILFTKTPLTSFIQQYILFPLSFGELRLGEGFLFPIEFKRLVLRFKLIHLSWITLLVIAAINISKNYKYVIEKEFLCFLSLIFLTLCLVVHQLMTINGLFIFFLIPILIGFSNIYYIKYFNNKFYIVNILILLCFFSTFHYGYKYIHKRDFADLRKVDISQAIDAKKIDLKLKNLKWITPQYPNNPNEEILLLNNAIEYIKKDNSKKIIVTDYQFISVILDLYDNSPNKVWYSFHVYPTKENKYFKIYQKFFIKKIKDKNIKTVYTVRPLHGVEDPLKDILNKECIKKEVLTKILERQIIKKCKQIENF